MHKPTISEIIAARAARDAGQKEQGKPPAAKALILTAAPPSKPSERAPAPAPIRSLSEPQGEAIPIVPVDATTEIQMWHAAMNAFASELCLVRCPSNPEHAWLAIRLPDSQDLPILLYSLPLYDHPRTQRDANQPF